jgi:dihydroorotate dehydrogenase
VTKAGPGRFYRWVFRHVLCRVDAEAMHRLSFAGLKAVVAIPGGRRALARACQAPQVPVQALGMTFPGPLGLAAGFDKDARGIDGLAALGFGFVEVGTVTALPQPGNPRPRLFRLPADRAIVNRMGFNNAGADAVAARLRRRARRRHAASVIVGVNIGKSKAVPEADAVADYVTSTRAVAPYADYLVVNVSSPNTPGLRDLQSVEKLRPLLVAVRETADNVAHRRVPLLVKIAPDLADDDIVAVADLAGELGLDGVVATNTTISRDGLATPDDQVRSLGAGGLSGEPLQARALEVLKLLRGRLDDAMTIISVGGVTSADDVIERLSAGAGLVQAYTGLIYGGPLWPARVTRRVAAAAGGKDQE